MVINIAEIEIVALLVPFSFASLCDRYGMINHVVYDVFITGDDDDRDEHGLRGTSRFDNDFERFTEKGLQFK